MTAARPVPIAHRFAGSYPADRNPVAALLARCMPGSRRVILGRLRSIAQRLTNGCCDEETMAWARLRYVDLLRLRSDLEERRAAGMSVKSANSLLSAARSVLRECWRLHYMTAEDYQGTVDVPPLKGTTAPAGRVLTEEELTALFAACRADSSDLGLRDYALLVLLVTTGMRRAELARLDLADVTPDCSSIRVRWGKGGKQRTVYIGDPGAQQVVRNWIAARGEWRGALIVGFTGNRTMTRRGLCPAHIYEVLAVRARQAGIRSCSPHSLRRTFATRIWRNGGDLEMLRRLLGHSKLDTTAIYLRSDEDQERAVAALVKLPL